MTQITNVYTDFRRIEELVARGLWVAVKNAKGSCVSFTPKKVLELAEFGEDATPVMLTLVKHVLTRLYEHGLLTIDDSRSVKRFRLCRDSSLWEVIKKSSEPKDVFKFITQFVE